MLEAAIWDMDGTVSDTQIVYARAESMVLPRYGIEMSEVEITREYAGTKYEHLFEKLFERFGVDADPIAAARETRALAIKTLLTTRINPIEGALELINESVREGLRLALATTSRFVVIEYVLGSLGLTGKFHAIASGEEVVNAKPDPEIFLLAASRLKVLPENCVVVEDGVPGMMGAKRAGMKCVGLVPDVFRDPNREYPADLVVRSLRELSVDSLRQLWHAGNPT